MKTVARRKVIRLFIFYAIFCYFMDMETKRIRASGDGGRCTKQRSKQCYTRKRKYHGKRKSINDDTVVQVEDQGAHSSINSALELVEDGAAAVYCEATITASSSKILDIGSESHPNILSCYRLMDVNILDGIFNCLACPECYEVETLHLNDTNAKKKGLARLMYLKCNSCTYVKEFYTSKNVMILSKKGGVEFMEVNLRAVYGMQAFGDIHR